MEEDEVFTKGGDKAVWEKYCGFLDLSLDQFMDIQADLLLEEIELVANTPLGKNLIGRRRPTSIPEFRHIVPLTTYDDYAIYLNEKNEKVLAEKPYLWARTAGRKGAPKWIPWAWRGYEVVMNYAIAAALLASANKKGNVNIREGMRVMGNIPPRPYGVGHIVFGVSQRFGLETIPPMELAERMGFHERIEKANKMALRTGADLVFSLASVLVKLGEGLSQEARGVKLSASMLHPAVLLRLARAAVRARMAGRRMLPRDLWCVKGILCGGTDAAIYKDKVAYYWGRSPHEHYASTEAGIAAMQSWNKKWMTLTPASAFYEFIPEEEWLRSKADKNYEPATVLLNEVEAGKLYELVITQFYGMPLLRYRKGDLIRIVALSDDETGVNLPQLVFHSRADDLIDIAGFPRLDEKTIWEAITNIGIDYEDWSARKEYVEGEPILRLYLELKQDADSDEIEHLIHDQLCAISSDYHDMDKMLQIRPLRVALVPKGSFKRYMEEKVKAGADLAHLKPAHINPSEEVVQALLQLGQYDQGGQ